MKKNFSAFSLIELSIVILIIGILVAGITQSSRLVKAIRINAAQNLTKSSDINSIKDLVFWVEPTLDGSITSAANGSNPEDGDTVSAWNDINPQLSAKINVSQSTAGNRPTYKADGISGLPSLSFDGNDFLANATSVPIAAGDDSYSIFIVWKPVTANNDMLISQGTNANSRLAGIYVGSSGEYGFAGYQNDYRPLTAVAGKSYVMGVKVDNSTSTNISLFDNSLTANSGLTGGVGGNYSNLDVSAADFVIGGRANDHTQLMDGLISEALVFDRALKTEEIQAIMKYLSKKYGIKQQ